MRRYLLCLVLLAGLLASPARADDISAAGRGVVRVVVIAHEDGEVVDFGHGSGFAVGPNRVVTNAHVVAMARELPPELVAVGIVPSEGSKARRARVIAFDPARDLALLEVEEGTLAPLALFVGPLEDGAPVAALGYPGNVDLATAQSMDDYITPIPPTRSVGIFSNLRPINGIATLLHTANIARGHSGGPLLDQCGRVLGVNTLITRAGEGDSTFAFAVANRELTAFLRDARQPFRSIAAECVSMIDRLRADRDRLAAAEQARAAAEASRAAAARAEALAAVADARETRAFLALLMLVLALVAFGGGGLLFLKGKPRQALYAAGAGAALILGSVLVFFTRPSHAAARPAAAAVTAAAAPASFAGRNLCRLVPDRSRVLASSDTQVPLEWSETGCVNGRTQYARNGDTWTRVLVPEGEEEVVVAQFKPGEGEYVVSRYLLGAEAMDRVRALRRDVDVKACTADEEARTVLADQQREIGAALPRLPNERLVYSCAPAGAG